MADAVGFSILVCVAALGLVHLAVHAPRHEHTVAASVLCAVALPLVLVHPEVSALLLLTAFASYRLRGMGVPDTVPAEWGEG